MSLYLPNGDGAEVPLDVPVAIPGQASDGSYALVPAGHLALSAQGPTTVHVTWNNGTPEFAEHLDYERSPTLIPVPAGVKAVRLRRERGTNDLMVVTASWRP